MSAAAVQAYPLQTPLLQLLRHPQQRPYHFSISTSAAGSATQQTPHPTHYHHHHQQQQQRRWHNLLGLQQGSGRSSYSQKSTTCRHKFTRQQQVQLCSGPHTPTPQATTSLCDHQLQATHLQHSQQPPQQQLQTKLQLQPAMLTLTLQSQKQQQQRRMRQELQQQQQHQQQFHQHSLQPSPPSASPAAARRHCSFCWMPLLRGSATVSCCWQSPPTAAAAATAMEKTRLQLLLTGKQPLAAHGS
jgi:hypothetical protein